MTRFSSEVRFLVAERAGRRCDLCGLVLLRGAHLHHRIARGMGGTLEAISGSPENALYLHPSCHAWVERHRDEALAKGFLCRHGTDPAEVPVRLWKGWHTLDRYGGLTPVAAVEEPGGVRA